MGERTLRVPPRSVFAAVLLQAMRDPLAQGGNWPSLVDLTKKIVDLKKTHRLDTSDISIRADRDGWISDDLSSFVNRFVLFGLASQNPVKLSPEALERCTQVVLKDRERRPGEVDKLLELLHLTTIVPRASSAGQAGTPISS